MKNIFFLFLFVFTLTTINMFGQDLVSKESKLAVLWTSGDIEVAEKVCFIYTHTAKKSKWFDEVVLIVWGPSAKLLSESPALQKSIKEMIEDGVVVQACSWCANHGT